MPIGGGETVVFDREMDREDHVAVQCKQMERGLMDGRAYRLAVLAATVSACVQLAGCGSPGNGQSRGASAPLVKVEAPRPYRFVERIEAVGTARANEQVTVAAPVTERIERLYFDDGDFVQRGQLIAMLDQGQEVAALNAAQATERQAKAQLERVSSLSRSGFATAALLDTQVATSARARAEADDARARIADRTIRAPLSGLVSLRTISAGSIVAAGAPIATVSDLSRIKLDFTVAETALRVLRRGQPIDVAAAAYPDETFSGAISTIDPLIDPSTRAVLVRAVLPNPGARLKPGMLLTVHVRTAERTALSVPELSVIGEGEDRYVYIVGKDGKAVRTPVKTGLRDGGHIEVLGLPAQARVISEGVVKVSDGVTVKIAGEQTREGG